MMTMKKFSFYGNQAVLCGRTDVPSNADALMGSGPFGEVVEKFIHSLKSRDSPLLEIFLRNVNAHDRRGLMVELLRELASLPAADVSAKSPVFRGMLADIYRMSQFVEELYNYWRQFERFFICNSDPVAGIPMDRRPYRTFNETVESLNHVVRKAYRDICENITGDHPRIYRQVPAGCQVGIIAAGCKWEPPPGYAGLAGIPFIRQVLIIPPLIIDPPANKRSGEFALVDENPLEGMDFRDGEWMCYPAKVCDLVVYIFFNMKFVGLGTALANLFDLADEEDLQRKPDAVYAYGVPAKKMERFSNKTVFFDDKKNGMLSAAVPDSDEFGYFGYLKKMALTLHNVIMMKRGRLPIHGAMVKIVMMNGRSSNLIIWGDTGTGKSELLEAFRAIGKKSIKDMTVIFDDMGTLELGKDGKLLAYGTETGAFVRLDDLSPGFALGNIDRSIIMSPQKINARVVLPVTTMKEVTGGHRVDFLLYANNYEQTGTRVPIFDEMKDAASAAVFRAGTRMSKGTTTETGLVKSFYANPFGPVQYPELYEKLAEKYFRALFRKGVRVAQLRTRLGIPGFENKGAEAAAEELFRIIAGK